MEMSHRSSAFEQIIGDCEASLRRALSISNGNVAILWQSGVTKTLLLLAIAVIVVPPLLRYMRKRQQKTPGDIPSS